MPAFSGRHFSARRGLCMELEALKEQIEAIASGQGLDFFETRFELCRSDEIHMLAAYGGFPNRYPHWRFGMDYLQMQRCYDFGASKIYELVINSDPAYAYLLESNRLVDHKLVMSHVYGHVDFFKNNIWFANTHRDMLDRTATNGARIRTIVQSQGEDMVERFLDACLSIENLVDPYGGRPSIIGGGALRVSFPDQGMDLRHLDVVAYICEYGDLTPWQREILSIVREEACYFQPQLRTKVINEGWATFWHTQLMTQFVASGSDVIDYATQHARACTQQAHQINPYKLGVALFRDIEDRWNQGKHGPDWEACDDMKKRECWDTKTQQGREKIFSVRQTHNDMTFIDTFLTEDFCREKGFFTTVFDEVSGKWVVKSDDFRDIKKVFLNSLPSMAAPKLSVRDISDHPKTILELDHRHYGVDVRMDWAEPTLCNIARLWGGSVILHTKIKEQTVALRHDGETMTRTEYEEASTQ